jgi:hypothetical protein
MKALGGAAKVAEWDAASKGKKLPERVKGSYALGTPFVPITGLYKLHKGEQIMPATEQQRADLAKQRGVQAAKMTDPAERRRYIAESANIDKDYEGMAQKTSAMENVLMKRELLGSYKKGTKSVPKTGVYKLHKGEAVIPAKENKEKESPAEKDMKKRMKDIAKKALSKLGGEKKPRKKPKMHITPADNEGYHVQHDMQEGMEGTGMHVYPDLKGLIGHIQKHYGEEMAEGDEE